MRWIDSVCKCACCFGNVEIILILIKAKPSAAIITEWKRDGIICKWNCWTDAFNEIIILCTLHACLPDNNNFTGSCVPCVRVSQSVGVCVCVDVDSAIVFSARLPYSADKTKIHFASLNASEKWKRKRKQRRKNYKQPTAVVVFGKRVWHADLSICFGQAAQKMDSDDGICFGFAFSVVYTTYLGVYNGHNQRSINTLAKHVAKDENTAER